MDTKKKNELILIAVLFFTALLFLVSYRLWFKSPGDRVVVTIDGVTHGSYLLSKNLEETIETKEGFNVLQIQDGKVSVKDADCSDRICVNHISIEKNGETIICLPHKLVVEIRSSEAKKLDGITY